jgi:hypothetical protein
VIHSARLCLGKCLPARGIYSKHYPARMIQEDDISSRRRPEARRVTFGQESRMRAQGHSVFVRQLIHLGDARVECRNYISMQDPTG